MPYLAPDPEAYLGQSVGSGQCVADVCVAAIAPPTANWQRGALARSNATIARGTAIATFDPDGTYSNHTDGRSHAAIYLKQDGNGLTVLDQWLGQVVHQRPLAFGNVGATPANDGNQFYIIEPV